MLTRKHFQAAADIMETRLRYAEEYFGKSDLDPVRIGYKAALEDVACDLADYFFDENDRFDREKFIEACGLK